MRPTHPSASLWILFLRVLACLILSPTKTYTKTQRHTARPLNQQLHTYINMPTHNHRMPSWHSPNSRHSAGTRATTRRFLSAACQCSLCRRASHIVSRLHSLAGQERRVGCTQGTMTKRLCALMNVWRGMFCCARLCVLLCFLQVCSLWTRERVRARCISDDIMIMHNALYVDECIDNHYIIMRCNRLCTLRARILAATSAWARSPNPHVHL
jgi:hypothetical protein